MEVTRLSHTDKDRVEGKIEGDIEIFVPGRLCILGEHSDWAAEFRTVNPSISYGKKETTIVTVHGSHVTANNKVSVVELQSQLFSLLYYRLQCHNSNI
jgi:galactokinase